MLNLINCCFFLSADVIQKNLASKKQKRQTKRGATFILREAFSNFSYYHDMVQLLVFIKYNNVSEGVEFKIFVIVNFDLIELDDFDYDALKAECREYFTEFLHNLFLNSFKLDSHYLTIKENNIESHLLQK